MGLSRDECDGAEIASAVSTQPSTFALVERVNVRDEVDEPGLREQDEVLRPGFLKDYSAATMW